MKFTEAVFRHPVHGTRVYFCDANMDGDTVAYQARAWLRKDPRNAGIDEREFAFEGFRPPQGPTPEELATRPPLRVLDGGKKPPPALAW